MNPQSNPLPTVAVKPLTPAEATDQAHSLVSQVNNLIVCDQNSYDLLVERLRAVKQMRADVASIFDPIVQKAHAAWKEATQKRQLVDGPLANCEAEGKRKLAVWDTEQRRKEEAERQRRREEEERLAAEIRERQIERAEAAGASVREVEAIINAPMPVIAPTQAPQSYTRAAGVATRETWSAEVVDLKALCRAVADGTQPLTVVEPNLPVLNALARSLKQAMNVPGVRAVAKTGVSIGGR